MLDWLSRFWRIKGAAARDQGQIMLPALRATAEHNAHLWPDMHTATRQATIYTASPWVYVAVNRIAEAAALVPLGVYRLEGEQRVAVSNHPLERLLNAPNPFMSRFELFEATVAYLELQGNAYWALIADERGRPAQIWPLRPERVRIVPDARRFVRGYVYEIDGQQIPLEATEVVHFKRWHPANDFYGLSALEAGRLAIQSDQAMAEWNRNTFGRDRAVPAGILNIRDYISEADFQRLKHEWTANYGGSQRRTAFLRGGSVEWQSIGLNHSDLDFLKGRQANRDEILNLFGIPVGLVSENATEANAKVAERAFIERTLWPKLVRLAQKISQELLPFWPGEHVAHFDDIRPTDISARLDEIRTASTVLSINEIRARYYQLEPVEWGTLPVNMQAVSSAAEAEPEADTADTDDTDETPSDISTPEAAKAELARWERYALKRLRRPNSRPFSAECLPPQLAAQLTDEISAASSEDEIHAAFAQVRASLADAETAP